MEVTLYEGCERDSTGGVFLFVFSPLQKRKIHCFPVKQVDEVFWGDSAPFRLSL